MRRKHYFSRKNRGQLTLESLETRHVLASVVPFDQVGFHVAENSGEQTVRLSHDDVQLVGDAEFGSISQSENGVVRFSPAADFLGIDSFQFTYTDGGETVTDTAYIHVTESIYALPDWIQIAPGTASVALDLLVNDYRIPGVDSSVVSIVNFDSATNGTLTLSEDGREMVYEPNAEFIGMDSFSYTTRDAFGNESSATATIDVTDKAGTGQFSNLEHFYIESLSERVRALRFSFGTPEQSSRYNFVEFVSDDRVDLVAFDGNTNMFQAMMMRSDGQVEGVDEGNIVLRDGNRLYVAAGNELRVADITDLSSPTMLDTISFDHPISELFSYKGRTTVVTDSTADSPDEAGWNVGWLPSESSLPPQFDSREIGVHVLELTDSIGFELVFSTQLDGDFHDARFIDGILYVVAGHDTQLEFGTLATVTTGDVDFFESVSDFVERNRAESLSFGEYQTTGPGGVVSGQLFQFDDLTASEITTDGVSSVTTFDTTGQDGSPVDADAVSLLRHVEIYASTNSLYLLSEALPAKDALFDPLMNEGGTQIQRLDFLGGEAGVDLAASGRVSGLITDQFSADEHNGFFRIATTAQNEIVSLFVLEQNEDGLEIVSSVEDIAPGERIYATRFDGDRAFVTTFRQVDPMFVIDLSDPTTPMIDGELKIPSYSNFLEVIDEDYVVGIGRDVRDGMFQGLQVSLFNVSNATEPKLVAQYVFEGGRDTWSSVASAWDLLDYQAVTFDAESGVLAIPTHTSFQWGGGSEAGINEAISVLQVDISSESIEFVGEVDFADRVNRSLHADGLLFGVSDNELRIVNVLNPSETVASLDLTSNAATPVGDLPLQSASLIDLNDSKTDVNQDGVTSAHDALLLVNMIREHGFAQMSPGINAACDVNEDGYFSPLDFLEVVNELNKNGSVHEPWAQTEMTRRPAVTTTPGIASFEMGPFLVNTEAADQLVAAQIQEDWTSRVQLQPTSVNFGTTNAINRAATGSSTESHDIVNLIDADSIAMTSVAPTVKTGTLTFRQDESSDEDEMAESLIELLFGQFETAELARLG